ncbi:MAG: cytochrome c-type biogenesis protein CcmH [Thiotrichaceae bacterium]|nr:cytochrome c-type biogenesis protein CcmH [Thiotrichaceae bacterium]
MKYLITVLLFFTLSAPVYAAIEVHEFNDAATEEDYKNLIEELRCLVCQNQNLSGSDADLAKDLRQQTYELLQQGKSREEVVDYMVTRYGDFVLYRPPVKSSTILLWAGPFALLFIVLIVVMLKVKKTRTVEAPEQKNLDQAKNLLADDQHNSGAEK